MKFDVLKYPDATLPEDRRPWTVVDGAGCLILCRNEYSVHIGNDVERLTLANINAQGVGRATSRLSRFLVFAKAAWHFSK